MIPVIADRTIPLNGDMAKKELQIKTESKLGSDDYLYVKLTSDTSLFGSVQIYFRAKMEYAIGSCTNSWDKAFDREPTITVPSLWRMRIISRTSVQVWCNDVLVLTYLFKNADNSVCVSSNPQTITGFMFFKLSSTENLAAKLYKIVESTGKN